MDTSDWVTASISVAALAFSSIALITSRVFSKRDFRRDRAFALVAKHHRTALALAAGDPRRGGGSNDRVEHLRRTQVQLQALGYPDVAAAFGDVIAEGRVWKENEQWLGGENEVPIEDQDAVGRLTEEIEREFKNG